MRLAGRSFTQDGQLHETLAQARDQRFGISSAEKHEQRKNIEYPPIAP
jgi:hypothetical protein